MTDDIIINEKSWLVSKRIWLNLSTIIGAIILRLTGYQVTSDDTEMIILCLAGLNIFLTFISNKNIVLATQKPANENKAN
jgi:hypothetical protein